METKEWKIDFPLGRDFNLPNFMANIEKGLVMQALQQTGYNQVQAAAILGITRDQIRYRMEQYDLFPRQKA